MDQLQGLGMGGLHSRGWQPRQWSVYISVDGRGEYCICSPSHVIFLKGQDSLLSCSLISMGEIMCQFKIQYNQYIDDIQHYISTPQVKLCWPSILRLFGLEEKMLPLLVLDGTSLPHPRLVHNFGILDLRSCLKIRWHLWQENLSKGSSYAPVVLFLLLKGPSHKFWSPYDWIIVMCSTKGWPWRPHGSYSWFKMWKCSVNSNSKPVLFDFYCL